MFDISSWGTSLIKRVKNIILYLLTCKGAAVMFSSQRSVAALLKKMSWHNYLALCQSWTRILSANDTVRDIGAGNRLKAFEDKLYASVAAL